MSDESKDKSKGKISRRRFVAGTVTGAAVGLVVGAAGGYLGKSASTTTEMSTQTNTTTTTAQPWLPAKWDYTADVVVVGGGIAGLSGAIEAANAGAKVILLEKAAAVGGATITSGGLVYAANTVPQQQNGITDTVDAMIAHYTHAARGLADPNQISIAAQKSADNINFMIGLGASYGAPTVSGAEVCEGQPPIPRVHATTADNGKTTGGKAVIEVLQAGAVKAGVTILTSTQALSLISTSAKEVLGVQARSGGSTINVKANKGVILACGGFQGSKAMQVRFCEKAYNSLPLGPTGLTGDGILMGLALGADTVVMEEMLGAPGLMLPGATSASFIYVPEFVPGAAIRVNSQGLRYVDETIYYEHNNEEQLRQETYKIVGTPFVYEIFDQTLVKTLGGGTIVPGFSADLSAEVKASTVIQAPTISALATAINLDPTRLQATITAWNGYAQTGKDLDFGRTTGLGAIQTPPFYAIQTFSTMFDTNGGLKINSNAQVIDTNGNVIPRLYAAGTNSGGVIGEYYPGSGTALNQGLTFGRIAGAYIAKQQAWT